MSALMRVVATTCLAGCGAAIIDPEHSMNLTMYHINPFSAGVLPVDEDTGDLDGILYFYLGTFLLPLECSDASGIASFDCDNPERTSADMVHTYMDLEVDERLTNYSACNLCTTGIDSGSRKPCVVGEYVCNCGMSQTCDETKVGMESVQIFSPHEIDPFCKSSLTDLCGAFTANGDDCRACLDEYADSWSNCTTQDLTEFCPVSSTCQVAMDTLCGDVKDNGTACTACKWQHNSVWKEHGCYGWDVTHYCPNTGCAGRVGDEWKCWHENIVKKTGGKWYSPRKGGLCHDDDEGTCGWRVKSMFSVNETCVKESVMSSVEDFAPECFDTCGVRNASSPCWLGCFFGTILGHDAGYTVHADVSSGAPLEVVERGYVAAFKPESEGGCPRIPVEDARPLIM